MIHINKNMQKRLIKGGGSALEAARDISDIIVRRIFEKWSLQHGDECICILCHPQTDGLQKFLKLYEIDYGDSSTSESKISTSTGKI